VKWLQFKKKKKKTKLGGLKKKEKNVYINKVNFKGKTNDVKTKK